MRSVPRSPSANWRMRSSATSSCGSTRLATASRYCPAWVSRRVRPSRSQMSVPEMRLELLHRMAQRRLGEAEHAGGRGERALLLDLANDGEMSPFEHDQ